MNNNPTNHDNEKHKAVDWKTKSAETRSSTFETHSASHSQPNQTTSQGYQTASPKTSSAQTNRPKQPSPSYSLSNQNTTKKIRIKPLPVIIVIILLLVSIFIVKSCSSKENSSSGDSTHSTQSTIQQQESSQEVDNSQQENFTQPNDSSKSQNAIQNTSTTKHTTTQSKSTTTTTTTPPPSYLVIDADAFSGKFTSEKQEIEYRFTPRISGKYRFDFDINDVQCDYRFFMYTPDGTDLASTYYSNGGKTVELVANNTYTIILRQYSGFPSYSITIGVPNNSKIIEGTSFSGSITYKDQEDIYTYTAPKTGRYRFDFNIDNVQSDYKFKMSAPNNSELANTYYSNGGKTVDLNAGESYTIIVKQYSGNANYTINIGIPNDSTVLDGTSFSGSLTYKDQENIYTYIAPKSGRYRFDFDTDNVQSDYKFIMSAPNNSELANTYYSNGGKTVDLNAGESYTIKIKQYSGTVNYTITIGVPNDPSIVTGMSLSGNLTYKDQENVYTFTAPSTGQYRFDFNSDNVQSDYKFVMYASNNSQLANTYYSNGNKKVELTAGEVYTIIVQQYSGKAGYEIIITPL